MTDLEKLKELLDSYGQGYEEVLVENTRMITVTEGYNGFFTDFSFDLAGKFKEMGAYE